MAGTRKRGQEIRQFILRCIEGSPSDVVNRTCEHFKISRQAVNTHVRRLVKEEKISFTGTTKNRKYFIPTTVVLDALYPLDGSISEDVVWSKSVKPLLNGVPENVIDIWHHGITEMINNAIDHSSGKAVIVTVKQSSIFTEVAIYDDGEGIFKKIQKAVGLQDERHSVLELAKGKLTTDPENHSGEGIFFSSRMFDNFTISSGCVFFSHTHDQVEDWILEHETGHGGTLVAMKLSNESKRISSDIFDKFAPGDSYGFTESSWSPR